MLILALETATVVSGVAVATETRLLSEVTVARLTHSETLQSHVALALEMAGVSRREVEGVAVSLGPGSFTGLRIGLSAAKAMAYAWGVPLVGVPTLAALAAQFPAPALRVVAMMDAQKGNVYTATYEWREAGPVEISPLAVSPLDEVVARCAAIEGAVILTGDAAQKKLAERRDLPAHVRLAPPDMIMPRAAAVARLGLLELAAGRCGNVMDMAPLYIRRSEAEVLWEARQKKAAP
ncbi:MAG: tRNA (adenosine(37)-N6)-threonylcarbamoyltransferase complex dimerization subunit type 1 TsaB [Schwartzia sp. (in: firmicutes)]